MDKFEKKQKKISKLKEWYKDFKKNLKCVICGEADYRCLDFHHIKPKTKKLTIARMVSLGKSRNKILEEIKKTVCYCSNCHRKEHIKY